MKEIKIKDVKVGDILLDADGIEVEVESIKPFDDEEMFSWVRGVEDGIGRMGTNPKNAKVRLVKRIPSLKRLGRKIK